MGYMEELDIIAAEEEAKKKAEASDGTGNAAAVESAAEAEDTAINSAESEESEDLENADHEKDGDPVAESDEDAADTAQQDDGAVAEEEPTKKKGPFIQVPVIISICLVALALIGYFVFTAFFLRVPQGVIWSKDYDGVTYFFEFKDDNVFKSYVGSVELTSVYQNANYEGEDYLMVNADAGDFYAGQTAKYTVTGSRILGNQELTISYGEDSNFTFVQASGIDNPLTLPEDFVPDEELVGSWVFQFYGYDYCTVTFGDDGAIKIDYTQNGVAYNGTYTVQDGTVNFTYYVKDYVAQPIEYKVEGDKLTFMDMEFTRVTEATPDEAV